MKDRDKGSGRSHSFATESPFYGWKSTNDESPGCGRISTRLVHEASTSSNNGVHELKWSAECGQTSDNIQKTLVECVESNIDMVRDASASSNSRVYSSGGQVKLDKGEEQNTDNKHKTSVEHAESNAIIIREASVDSKREELDTGESKMRDDAEVQVQDNAYRTSVEYAGSVTSVVREVTWSSDSGVPECDSGESCRRTQAKEIVQDRGQYNSVGLAKSSSSSFVCDNRASADSGVAQQDYEKLDERRETGDKLQDDKCRTSARSNAANRGESKSDTSTSTSNQDKKKTRTFKSVVEQRLGRKDRLYDLVSSLLNSIAEEQKATDDLITSFQTAREIKVPLAELYPASTSQETPKPKKKISLRKHVPLMERIEKARRAKDEEAEENERVIAEEMELLERQNEVKTESLIHIPVGDIEYNYGSNKDRGETHLQSKPQFTKATHDCENHSSNGDILGRHNEPNKVQEKLDVDKEANVEVEVERDDDQSERYFSKESIFSDEGNKSDGEIATGRRYSPSEEHVDDVHNGHYDNNNSNEHITDSYDSYSDDFDSSDIDLNDNQKLEKEKSQFIIIDTNRRVIIDNNRRVIISKMNYRSSNRKEPLVSKSVVVSEKTRPKNGHSKQGNKPTQSPYMDYNNNTKQIKSRNSSSKRKYSSNEPNTTDRSVNNNHELALKGRPKSKGSAPPSRRAGTNKKLISLNLLEMYEENGDLQKIGKSKKHYNDNRVGVKTIGRTDLNSPRNAKYRRKNQYVPLPPKNLTKRINREQKHVARRSSLDSFEESIREFRAYSSRQENRRYQQPDDTIWRHIDVKDDTSNASAPVTSREEKLDGDDGGRMKTQVRGQGSARSTKSTTVRFVDMPITDAIRSVKGSHNLPPCRDVVETTPRKDRVSQIYSDLKKDRRGTDYMSTILPTSPSRNHSHW